MTTCKQCGERDRWRDTRFESTDDIEGEIVEYIDFHDMRGIARSNVPTRDFKYWRPVGPPPCEYSIEEHYNVKE